MARLITQDMKDVKHFMNAGCSTANEICLDSCGILSGSDHQPKPESLINGATFLGPI